MEYEIHVELINSKTIYSIIYMKQDFITFCTETGENQDECDAAAAVCLDRPQLNSAAVSTMQC